MTDKNNAVEYLYLYQYKKGQKGADPRNLNRIADNQRSKTNP
jgi:hypothetical protein